MYKPVAAHDDLAPPEFQICKGTRRVKNGASDADGKWRDIKKDDYPIGDDIIAEEWVQTAIREGEEEIGLIKDNIEDMLYFGVADYKSQRTEKTKYMHVFACEVIDKNNFAQPDLVEGKTAERKWCDIDWFSKYGRKDHINIISVVNSCLGRRL